MRATVKELSLITREVEKIWGNFIDLYKEENYLVKKISIKPQERLSLQSHNHRNEVWVIVNGLAQVDYDGFQKQMKSGEYIFVPIRKKHRVKNIGKDNLIIIEVQFGDKIDECDIVRYQDDYGRKGSIEM